MEFTLPPLPYAQDALDPVISKRTVATHYEKHHAGYVGKLEAAIDDASRGKTLEEIIIESHKAQNAAVFNNAAQVWNHTFYWNSMAPEASDIRDDHLRKLVDDAFGGVDGFKEKFKSAAAGQFGSGWAWLVYDPAVKSLAITSTGNAANPMTEGQLPLLTIDVWEHAYYLDYQQDRAGYIDGFMDKLINWEFAASNLKG